MKKGVAIAAVALIVAVAVAYWASRGPAPAPGAPSPTQQQSAAAPNGGEDTTATQPPTGQASAEKPGAQTEKAPPKPAPKGFCERDFADTDARAADAAALQSRGGLVHIFEREAQLKDPYGCADFYLAHGLDVNAVDPRPDDGRLTGLFFAIKRNDPKMLRFMLDHGADLQQRAGEKQIKPYGYAVFLALKDQHTNRNWIIEMLDSALSKASAGNDADKPATGGEKDIPDS